ncbi:hypothetical protein MTO96_010072 [Rhipicephalus appendiculatus]
MDVHVHQFSVQRSSNSAAYGHAFDILNILWRIEYLVQDYDGAAFQPLEALTAQLELQVGTQVVCMQLVRRPGEKTKQSRSTHCEAFEGTEERGSSIVYPSPPLDRTKDPEDIEATEWKFKPQTTC